MILIFVKKDLKKLLQHITFVALIFSDCLSALLFGIRIKIELHSSEPKDVETLLSVERSPSFKEWIDK